MQTINLEFKQLDKLPVPESRNELIFTKNEFGDVRCYQAQSWAARFTFDVVVRPHLEYAHVKVTAAETKFKVGDRVQFLGKRGLTNGVIVDIENSHYAVIDTKQTRYEIDLRALTLITNE